MAFPALPVLSVLAVGTDLVVKSIPPLTVLLSDDCLLGILPPSAIAAFEAIMSLKSPNLRF